MIALGVGGNVSGSRACAATPRDAVLSASLCRSLGALPAASRGKASACSPDIPAAAPRQGFKATAPQGFEPRPVGAESVLIEAAPSGRITDASTPLALSVSSGGLSMAKNAANLICPPLKAFPVNGLGTKSLQNGGASRNCMILQSYALCEVTTLANMNGRPLLPHHIAVFPCGGC
jgi:hypothetical protein